MPEAPVPGIISPAALTTPSLIQQASALAAAGEDFVLLDSAGHRHPQRDQHNLLACGGIEEEVVGRLEESQGQQQLRTLLTRLDETQRLFGWVDYDGNFRFTRFAKVHREPVRDEPSLDLPPSVDLPPLQADSSDQEYLNAIAQAQGYIAAGDIYQVNLARRWSLPWPRNASAFALYRRWRALSTAPQSAFLRLGGRQVLSASPETFLTLNDSGRIASFPIKGTVRSGASREEDNALRQALVGSSKERAELLMITDLLRNDLGRVARTGSVVVPSLHALESYGHLHHLVSTIEARLRPGLDPVDLLLATHPGGSITGAPKRRAREIIAELEPHPRGLYCGTIGWLSRDQLRLSIAIRTAVIAGTRLHYHAGSGIVADSIPARELAETTLKTKGFRHALLP